MILLALLMSCAVETAPTEEVALVPLDPPRLARRISLDLRGVLPSAGELDAVERAPEVLDELAAAWIEDPRFEERLVRLLAERWHTRIDEFVVFYTEYEELAEDPTQEHAFERAVGEEPLRLLARIAVEDRPWTEIVTADHTMADALLGTIWPLDRDEGPGWQEARYTDGRPAAGVLATNGLWWRYSTTISNAHRARAAALTRLLICEDFHGRPVSLAELPLLEEGDTIEDALRESATCMGCHSAIDPIATTLFGFTAANEHTSVEVHTYHPAREPLGPEVLGVEPAWFGRPVAGLEELGRTIAADPRFERCAAESAASMLWRREIEARDRATVDALLDGYLAAGGRLKPLLLEVMATPEYRAGALGAEASTSQEDAERTARLMGPALLESVVADLAELEWTWEGFDQLDNDTWGYRLLGGGVDGEYVTAPQAEPSLTWSLVVRRVAEATAGKIVAHDLVEREGTPFLLDRVDLETRPGDEAFETQLDAVVWRLHAHRATQSERDELGALWIALAEVAPADLDPAAAAWTGLLTALLRDPAFVGS